MVVPNVVRWGYIRREELKSESIVQSKLLMESKVAIKKVESSVCRITGETMDKTLNVVASLLSLKTIDELNNLEKKLESPEFCQAMIKYIYKLKGTSEDVASIIIYWTSLIGKASGVSNRLPNLTFLKSFAKKALINDEKVF
ncbi:uncharacterized protein ACRADG_006184 isoform 1-T1 [Cochliomyia hominivorax]